MGACKPYAGHHMIAARKDLLDLSAQIWESAE